MPGGRGLAQRVALGPNGSMACVGHFTSAVATFGDFNLTNPAPEGRSAQAVVGAPAHPSEKAPPRLSNF